MKRTKPKRKYVQKLTPEERSRIARETAAKRIASGRVGGRPKGSQNRFREGRKATTTRRVRKVDAERFDAMAEYAGVSSFEFFHMMIRQMWELNRMDEVMARKERDDADKIRSEQATVADNEQVSV